jgi:phosphatidylinositol alpha-mannosyltransferase
MKAADIVCAPSLYGESFGVVLLEAMAAGAVVVASDIPGYRDLMRDGVDGVLVPPGESEALRVALRTALDSPEKRESLRSAGLESADRYSTVRLAKSYIDLFTGGAG